MANHKKKTSEDTSVSHQKTFSATATKVQWAYVSTLELYSLLLLNDARASTKIKLGNLSD